VPYKATASPKTPTIPARPPTIAPVGLVAALTDCWVAVFVLLADVPAEEVFGVDAVEVGYGFEVEEVTPEVGVGLIVSKVGL